MTDIRCECHNLLAKDNNGKIEILCRKCKRLVLIESKGGRNEHIGDSVCSGHSNIMGSMRDIDNE